MATSQATATTGGGWRRSTKRLTPIHGSELTSPIAQQYHSQVLSDTLRPLPRLGDASYCRREPRYLPPPSLLCRPASIYVERMPRHERRWLRAEVEGGGTDFLDVAPAAERDAAGELLAHFRVLEEREVHLGGKRSRADRIHRDPVRRPFQR